MEYTLQRFRPAGELRIPYAEELNPQQLAAVTAGPGPALVLAGAGSGKTRTLTYRVAFLLEQGVAPSRILLLTFTNKAAAEMMRRAAALVGLGPGALWGGTFHSVGARVLRRHAELLGYRPDFTILDREDSARLIKACLAAQKIEARGGRFPKPDALADMISMAVNTRVSLRDWLKQHPEWSHQPQVAAQIDRVAADYAGRKQADNVMDFDDLLALWLRLLQHQESVREMYQNRFQFILVDEYQDTNRLQCELIDLLAAKHQNLMVVGDDAQSIYSWRGAEYRNILEFPQRYPQARICKIEYNYRSTPQILSLANAVMAGTAQHLHKELRAVRAAGVKPALVACQDGRQQAAFVGQRVRELHAEGEPLRNMAVLYRSHFHALELQLELTRQGVPYVITSGVRVFEQAHIKDVVAFLRLYYNPSDETSFKRLVLMLSGVGEKAADKLWVAYQTAWEKTGGREALPQSLLAALGGSTGAVPRKASAEWVDLLNTFRSMALPEVVQRGPSAMMESILKGGYEEYLEANYPKAASRREDLAQLAEFAQQFESLEEFLTQLSLLTNLEAEAERAPERGAPEDRLWLSSVHQAKGLEWDVVFVIMLCDGMFPSRRAAESPGGLEEELRLFYVAVTRARAQLYLCFPEARDVYGMATYQVPSPFVTSLPRHLVEEWRLQES